MANLTNSSNIDIKNAHDKKVCDSFEVKNIKIELEESDQKPLFEIKADTPIKTELKEHETLDDSKVLESRTTKVIRGMQIKKEFNEDNTILNEIKIELEDQKILPETLNIDCINGECSTETLNVKSENETVNLKSSNIKRKTREYPRHKCTECDYATDFRTNLVRHTKKHNNKLNFMKIFKCSQCSYSSEYKRNIIRHKITHQAMKPFHCEICQRYFGSEKYVKFHKKTQHSELYQEEKKEFEPQCPDCSYYTLNEELMNAHKLEHERVNRDNLRHKCTQCDYATDHKSNLIYHAKKKHNDTQYDTTYVPLKPFHCDVCLKSFAKEGSLENHMEKKHPDWDQEQAKVFQFPCPHCSYIAKSRKLFNRHKRKHGDIENVTKYSCSMCEYFTYYKANLQLHIPVHSTETPFLCEHCAFRTRTSLDLKKHIRNCHQNMGEHRHKCTQCNFATDYKRFFTSHMLTHSQENEWLSCPQCSYTTIDKRYLSTHIKRTHKIVDCKS